jgi:hypothetical protein
MLAPTASARRLRAAAPARRTQPARRGLVVRAERSYVMVKPDGVQRGHIGNIISRFEGKGFKVTGLKMFQTPRAVAEEHYKDLSDKPFYGKLVDYIVSGPVVCIVRPTRALACFLTSLLSLASLLGLAHCAGASQTSNSCEQSGALCRDRCANTFHRVRDVSSLGNTLGSHWHTARRRWRATASSRALASSSARPTR